MRNICYQSITGFIFLLSFNSAHAIDLIYGFNRVSVGQDLKTVVEFDQDDFRQFQKQDDLKLRIINGNKPVREDAILHNGKEWVWNKVVPFSEDLKFVILKDGEPVSAEYLADTKSSLRFSKDDAGLPIIKGVHTAPIEPVMNTEIKRLTIDGGNLKDCKDKVLVVVFDEGSNTLLWQKYDVLKNLSETGDIELIENMQPTIAIITDDGSCN